MSKYLGPKCKLCRRENTRLFLKGTRCDTDKCAITKKRQCPGQHGTRRGRLSEYGIQLREKQKAKRIYGLLEKQFRIYIEEALKSKGVTGEILLQKLEARLDNIVYRSGFAVSRSQARQLIHSGVFLLNGKVVTIPSIQVKIGDIVKPVDFKKVHLREGFVLPTWIEANVKEKYVKLSKLPKLDEAIESVNVSLIIEFYSR